MSRYSDSIRLLLSQGIASARTLAGKAGISQPTVSRALTDLGNEVLRIGAGPSIQYALRDSSRGFASVPIFRVNEDGLISELGTLIPVRSNGFVMVQTDGSHLYSNGLPWWFFDMRPQGYLGRAFALKYATSLNLPVNPEHWNDSEVIRALLAQGHDAIGNLLIGERAREHCINAPLPTAVHRAIDYPALARAASTGELAGSSAGGEQPKFCAYSERGHVLVKFTSPDFNPISERWKDLLLAEHLALSVLGIETDIFDFEGQRFLEVPRFDRIGQFGRIGVFSLRALDAEFVGDASAPWPALVRQLGADGHVRTDSLSGSAQLWAFGTLIGNTDMHVGNLSFISNGGRPYRLAPAYDMLPMGFAPRSSGTLVNELAPAILSSSVDGESWKQGLSLAETFLARISNCAEFSKNFSPCIQALRQHIAEAALRVARLA